MTINNFSVFRLYKFFCRSKRSIDKCRWRAIHQEHLIA